MTTLIAGEHRLELMSPGAIIAMVDPGILDLFREKPQMPRFGYGPLRDRGHRRRSRWSNDGVRANKQYRLKGIRP